MPPDRFKVEIVHILHPHLIWIQLNKGTGNEQFLIEQVGLYGILPLEKTINTENNSLETLKSNNWVSSATGLIKKILAESTEIWFIPTLIDRRVSIFDDNIQKYGDFEFKKDNTWRSLSQKLINSGLAYQDDCSFHQKLSKGDIKTKLSNVQIQEVIKEFAVSFQLKGIPKNVWETVLKKQMSVFLFSQKVESALTESNLEKHNNLMIKKVLESKMKDLDLCKDVEEESLGRASNRFIENSGLSSDLLKRKLYCAKKYQAQDSAAVLNNVKTFLDNNSMYCKEFENVGKILDEKGKPEKKHELYVDDDNMLNLRLHKTNNLNLENANEVINLNVCKSLENDVVSKEIKAYKNVKQHHNSPKVNGYRQICGPPGINPIQMKVEIIPQVYKNHEAQSKVIETEIGNEYNTKLGEDLSEINLAVSNKQALKKLSQKTSKDNKDDKKSTAIDVSDSSTQYNKSSSSSCLMLHKRFQLINKTEKLTKSLNTSDTSNKDVSSLEDTSKKEDSAEEDIDNIIRKLNNEYHCQSTAGGKDIIQKKDQDMDRHKLKNHVNPFQNMDPNISVFVDKLVTPILMVHSKLNKRIEPAYEMRDIYFNNHIRLALRNLSITRPMMLQSVSWLTILRGYSLLMISPMGSGKTMGYLPAVCRLVTDYSEVLVHSVGPIGIIVCATAESVAHVEQTARMFLKSQDRLIACYAGVDDLYIITRLLNGCDLFICTPPVLVRLLQEAEFGIDLRRLCTFVLDDCERLTVIYRDEIKLFLHKIKETLRNRAQKELKVQFILASRVWCDFMGPIAKRAPDTIVCIGAFQECVLYSKANTSANFVKAENKINHVLDFLKDVNGPKKTVIVCRTNDEVEMLAGTLKTTENYIFLCDNTMTVQDLYSLNISWAEYEDPLVGPVLICCDDNLSHMNITDAHNLIHYSLPSLFSMFCKRFSVLNDHYRSIFRSNDENVKIKILLEEANVEQLPKIINFIKRCTDAVPPVLDAISEQVMIEKDCQKAKYLVPICNNLLGLGYCPDLYHCRERHTILKAYDMPKEWLPKKGYVTFKILHYHSAILYSARLLSNIINGVTTKYPQTYSSLSMKLGMYYSKESNRKLHGIPEIGDYCAVSMKQDFFVRCQVLKVLNRYEKGHPNRVLINLIDEEKFEVTRDIHLYHLPEEIKSIKTCAVQVRLANIQPIDKDITFSDLATKHIKKISESEDDLYLKGNIYLTIGNSVIVDDLEVCEDLTSLNKTVVKYNVRQELLGKYAVHSVDHAAKLKKLCIDSGIESENIVVVSTPEPTKKTEKPKANWAYLKVDEMSCIFFDSAINPDTFFVRLDKFESCMTDLMKEIQCYVKNNVQPLTDVTKGDLVLAKFPDDSTYERARVDDVVADTIKCFFVDCGDWRVVPMNDLYAIPEKFINKLPFQAIECRLTGIQPPGENWTEFSTNWLCDKCLEDSSGNAKHLYIKCFTEEQAEFTGGHKYGVALIDTNSEQDVIINQLMVDLNLAQEKPKEIEFLSKLDLGKTGSDTIGSLDEDEWENLPPNEAKSDLSPNASPYVFIKKPLRSVPLIGSDDESDDSDRWNINLTPDLKGFFMPAFDKMVGKKGPALLPIDASEEKYSVKCITVDDSNDGKSSKSIDDYEVASKSDDSKTVELDSEDLISSPSGKTEESLGQYQSTEQELRRPKVVWWQNKHNLHIKIQIIVDYGYELIIEERRLEFKTAVNTTYYGFDVELYGVVDTNKCTHTNKGQYILIKLTKVLNKTWLTLTQDATIKKWITYDVDNIDTSSDEEVLDAKPLENIIKNIHYGRESDSDEDEIIDDANFTYKH